MKKYAADNLMLLRKYYSELYKLLRNRDRDKEEFILTQTRSGLQNLQVHINGAMANLHSHYDPKHEAVKWVESQRELLESKKSIFFYGFGLGYHIEEVINQYPDHKLFIYEPHIEIVLAAIEARDLSVILKHSNISIFGIGIDDSVQEVMLQTVAEHLMDDFHFAFSSSYYQIYRKEIEELQRKFRATVMNHRGNVATIAVFYDQWPENIIRNFSKVINSRTITDMKDCLPNLPVVVVGSGPSLDADIEYLRQIQQKAYIICAGSSIQALLARDIQPDMVVTIDGAEENYEVFKDLTYDTIPMVYASYVKHKIIAPMRDNLIHIILTPETITPYILGHSENDVIFHSTSSVTGTVMQIALHLGCTEVILVGQDLSYPGKAIYSKDVDHMTEKEVDDVNKLMTQSVENVQGGINPTTKAMLNTLRDIEILVDLLKVKIKFYNTSAIGAKIKGAEAIRFENIVDRIMRQETKKVSIEKLIESYAKPYDKRRISKAIAKVKSSVKEIDKVFIELTKLAQLLEDTKIKQGILPSLLIDIEQTWSRIVSTNAFKHIYQTTNHAQISIYKRYQTMIMAEENSVKKAELIYTHLGLVVFHMLNITPRLLRYFEETLEEIKTNQAQEVE